MLCNPSHCPAARAKHICTAGTCGSVHLGSYHPLQPFALPRSPGEAHLYSRHMRVGARRVPYRCVSHRTCRYRHLRCTSAPRFSMRVMRLRSRCSCCTSLGGYTEQGDSITSDHVYWNSWVPVVKQRGSGPGAAAARPWAGKQSGNRNDSSVQGTCMLGEGREGAAARRWGGETEC